MGDTKEFVETPGGALDGGDLVDLLGSMREGVTLSCYRQGQIGKRGYVGAIPDGLGVDDLHQYVAETWGAGRYVLRAVGVDPRKHATRRVFLPGAALVEIPDGFGRVANPQPASGSTVPVQVIGAAREPLSSALLQLLGGQTRSQETQTQILLRALLEQRGVAQPSSATGTEPLARVIDSLLATRLQAEQPRDDLSQLERTLGTFIKFQKLLGGDREPAAPAESDLESGLLKAIAGGMFGQQQQQQPPPGYYHPPGYPPPGYPPGYSPPPGTWPVAGFQGPPAGPQAFQTTPRPVVGPADLRAAQGGPRAATPAPAVSLDPRPTPNLGPGPEEDDDEDIDLEPQDVAARVAEIAETDEAAALDFFLEVSARLPPNIQAAIGRKLESAGMVPPSSPPQQPAAGHERPPLHLYTNSWSDQGTGEGTG